MLLWYEVRIRSQSQAKIYLRGTWARGLRRTKLRLIDSRALGSGAAGAVLKTCKGLKRVEITNVTELDLGCLCGENMAGADPRRPRWSLMTRLAPLTELEWLELTYSTFAVKPLDLTRSPPFTSRLAHLSIRLGGPSLTLQSTPFPSLLLPPSLSSLPPSPPSSSQSPQDPSKKPL